MTTEACPPPPDPLDRELLLELRRGYLTQVRAIEKRLGIVADKPKIDRINREAQTSGHNRIEGPGSA